MTSSSLPTQGPLHERSSSSSIVWLVLDSLRPDLIQFAPPGGASNTLERLLARGHFFPNVKATGPYTLPSIGSALTGQLPYVNGLNSWLPNVYRRFNYQCISLFELASYLGFEVSALTGQGRDFFPMFGVHKKVFFRTPQELRSHVSSILEDGADKRFLYIHVDWLHDARLSLGESATSAQFTEAFNRVSEQLGVVLTSIAEEADHFVLSSDHGMTASDDRIGRHREAYTGTYLSNKTLQSFIWIYDQKVKQGPQLHRELASSVDMFPTLAHTLGARIETPIAQCLHPHCRCGHVKAANRARAVFSLTGGLHQSPNKPNTFCIQTEHWKVIKTYRSFLGYQRYREEVYDLEADPDETRDLGQTFDNPQVSRLRSELTHQVSHLNEPQIMIEYHADPELVCQIITSRRDMSFRYKLNMLVINLRFALFKMRIRWLRLKTRFARFAFISHEI